MCIFCEKHGIEYFDHGLPQEIKPVKQIFYCSKYPSGEGCKRKYIEIVSDPIFSSKKPHIGHSIIAQYPQRFYMNQNKIDFLDLDYPKKLKNFLKSILDTVLTTEYRDLFLEIKIVSGIKTEKFQCTIDIIILIDLLTENPQFRNINIWLVYNGDDNFLCHPPFSGTWSKKEFIMSCVIYASIIITSFIDSQPKNTC